MFKVNSVRPIFLRKFIYIGLADGVYIYLKISCVANFNNRLCFCKTIAIKCKKDFGKHFEHGFIHVRGKKHNKTLMIYENIFVLK